MSNNDQICHIKKKVRLIKGDEAEYQRKNAPPPTWSLFNEQQSEPEGMGRLKEQPLFCLGLVRSDRTTGWEEYLSWWAGGRGFVCGSSCFLPIIGEGTFIKERSALTCL